MSKVLPRAGVVLLLAVLMAGCTGDGEVVKSYNRASDASDDADISFDVDKDGTPYVLRLDLTQGEGFVEFDIVSLSGFAFVDEGEAASPNDVEWNLGKLDAGRYLVDLQMDNYAGPLTAEVVATEGSGSMISIGGSFWDIAGVALTLVGLTGGGLLYWRRSNFLKREIHRIDHVYAAMHSDIATCRVQLLQLREELKDKLVKRKLNESQFVILDKRIDHHLGELPGQQEPQATGGTGFRPGRQRT